MFGDRNLDHGCRVDFDAADSILVQVGGQLPGIAEFKAWSTPRPKEKKNKGTHKIHLGPDHSSNIILPFVLLWKNSVNGNQ